MRKALIIIALVLLCTSCSQDSFLRSVTLCLNPHSWEAYGDELWYLVSYNGPDGSLKTLHVSQKERSVRLDIPTGQMVCVLARPLGFANPLGLLISPLDQQEVFYPSQQEGVLASILINLDSEARGSVNNHKMKALCEHVLDYRLLDAQALAKDVLLGRLSKDSFRTVSPISVSPMIVPDGAWISDVQSEGFFIASDEKTPPLLLAPGIHFYWNKERGLILKILVQADGQVFTFMEASPLL